MTMSELATIVEQRLPIKFALLNNNSLGLVRQLQDLFHDGLDSESKMLRIGTIKRILQKYPHGLNYNTLLFTYIVFLQTGGQNYDP